MGNNHRRTLVIVLAAVIVIAGLSAAALRIAVQQGSEIDQLRIDLAVYETGLSPAEGEVIIQILTKQLVSSTRSYGTTHIETTGFERDSVILIDRESGVVRIMVDPCDTCEEGPTKSFATSLRLW